MPLLLVRPNMYRDECLLSYLIRISDLNGFSQFSYMLKVAGFSWKNLRAPTHDIRTAEFSLKALFEGLGIQYSIPETANIYQTFRKGIDTPYLFSRNPKVCPECIIENGYCKSVWNYLPVIACPKHKTLLVDSSPSSGKRLSWYRKTLGTFQGKDEELIRAITPAPSQAIHLTNLFQKLSQGKSLVNRNIPVLFHGLNFCEALTIINFLSHYLFCLNNDSHFTPIKFENALLAKYYLDIWKIASNWPDGFYALLSQYIDYPMSSRGKGGINKHFRDIHERLYKQSANRGIALIKGEFDRYINQYWPETWTTAKVVRINIVEDLHKLISKKEAARLFKCHPSKIDRLIRAGKLELKIFRGKSYCHLDHVKFAISEETNNWTLSRFCQELGIGRHQAVLLLNSGLFVVLQKPSQVNRDWLIDSNSAKGVVSSLRAKATTDIIDGISLAGVQHQGYDISDVLRLMSNGSLIFNSKMDCNNPNSLMQFQNLKFK